MYQRILYNEKPPHPSSAQYSGSHGSSDFVNKTKRKNGRWAPTLPTGLCVSSRQVETLSNGRPGTLKSVAPGENQSSECSSGELLAATRSRLSPGLWRHSVARGRTLTQGHSYQMRLHAPKNHLQHSSDASERLPTLSAQAQKAVQWPRAKPSRSRPRLGRRRGPFTFEPWPRALSHWRMLPSWMLPVGLRLRFEAPRSPAPSRHLKFLRTEEGGEAKEL